MFLERRCPRPVSRALRTVVAFHLQLPGLFLRQRGHGDLHRASSNAPTRNAYLNQPPYLSLQLRFSSGVLRGSFTSLELSLPREGQQRFVLEGSMMETLWDARAVSSIVRQRTRMADGGGIECGR
jgi:hypothetical protein